MKTEGIIIHSLRYGDSSQVVYIYTQTEGMVPFLVRTSSGKRGVRAALLQPLSLVHIDFDMRHTKNLQSLRDIHISVPYTSLPFDMGKRCIVLFLSEVLLAALRGEQGANDTLFRFISQSLQWLDLTNSGYANFHLIFLLRLTRYLGYYPEHHPDADRYDLPLLLRFNYRTMRLLRLTADGRQDFLRRLLDYYAEQIPSFPAIRSAEILHEVLA